MADDSCCTRVSVPTHVVRRAFAEETDRRSTCDTGRYHGLNATAAEMLDALEAGATVAATAARIAGETGEPVARVEADL